MAATSTLFPTTVASTTGTTWTTTTNATGSGTGTTSAAWAVFTNATNGGSGGTGTINLSGYAAQAAGPASGDTIDSVVLSLRGNVAATARWTAASCTAQLFDGTTAIGSPVAIGTLSTSTSNVWTVTFTGANAPSYAQLSDLRVRVTAVHTSTTSSTFNVDTAGLVVNYTAPTVPTITDSVSAIPNLSARYRADQITGVSDGAVAATWPDASGYGYNATQLDPSLEPTWHSSVLNGKPVTRWNGAKWMDSAANPGATVQTIVAVCQLTNVTANRTIRGGLANASLQFRVDTAGAIQFISQNTVVVGSSTSTVSTGVFHYLVGTYNSTTGAYAFYLDGVAAGSGTNAQALTSTTTRLGDQLFTPNEPFVGDIAEVVTWNRVLTGPELATVDSYVVAQYGIGSATTVTGSGALDVPAATLAGSGAATVAGAGSPAATPATLSGAGTLFVTGAGAVTGAPATVTGAGGLALTGTGSLTAVAATISGAGNLAVTGAGALAATPATLAGTGSERLTGTGAVTPPAATLSGSGTVAAPGIVSGAGALAGPAAGMSGAGTLQVVGAGQLTAQAATAATAALLSLTGTGALGAPPSGLAGDGAVTAPVAGSGVLVAVQASLTGAGTVVDPTAPIVPPVISVGEGRSPTISATGSSPFALSRLGADRELAAAGRSRTLTLDPWE